MTRRTERARATMGKRFHDYLERKAKNIEANGNPARAESFRAFWDKAGAQMKRWRTADGEPLYPDERSSDAAPNE